MLRVEVDGMIFCQCTGVTDETVRETVREGAVTVSDVAARCGAGLRCDPCRDAVARVIEEEHPMRRRPPLRIPIPAHRAA